MDNCGTVGQDSNVLLAATVALGSIGAQGMAVEASKDIVDTAVAAGSFKTLAAALQAADLVDTLKGPGIASECASRGVPQ